MKGFGNSCKTVVGLTLAIHGNETAPLNALDELSKLELGNYIFKVIVVNEKAIERKKRFIDVDLNRIFPGNSKGNHEEQLAKHVLDELKGCEIVLDFHTSEGETPPFVITTKLDANHLDLCKRLGIKNAVFMNENPSNKKSLIDHCKLGVSIELGKHNSDFGKNLFLDTLNSFLSNEMNEIDLFETVEVLKKPSEHFTEFLTNFKEVKSGDVIAINGFCKLVASKNFYPILAGELNYTDTLCILCKKC